MYQGLKWRGLDQPVRIGPSTVMRFCDLRDANLEGVDFSDARFLGCHLNGACFRGASLQGTRFVGCFSSLEGGPTDFRGCDVASAVWLDSHLHALTDDDLPGSLQWPDELASSVAETLSERNDARYHAVERLGVIGHAVVAPILACLLADEEWEVRAVTLRTLGDLRIGNDNRFSHEDEALMKWMFLSLGDEHPLVREGAGRLVELLQPSMDVLRIAVDRLTSSASRERLAAMRSVAKLKGLDERYRVLWNPQMFAALLNDDEPDLRSECVHLLARLDDPRATALLLRGLSDPVASVRIDTLMAICALSDPPSVESIIPLLDDPVDEVRIQAHETLAELERP